MAANHRHGSKGQDDASRDENKSRSESPTGKIDTGEQAQLPEVSEDQILESFCRNIRLVTQGDPIKLLRLRNQMQKILGHYHSE